MQLKKKAPKEGAFDIAAKIVAPVRLYSARANNPQWEPLAYSEIKELCRTATERGLGSPFFANLLRSTLSTHVMTSHDLKGLAKLLLTPTQYTIFDAQWKKELETLLVRFLGHANQNLAALMTDHMAGEGVSGGWHIQSQRGNYM